ncbi:MAG: magnesium transporter [Rhizobiales bacterium]|nr:magnesium transporter [Hyphomicrobiales bacterium]
MENNLVHAEEPAIVAGDAVRLAEQHVPDIVEFLNPMAPEEAAAILARFPVERAAEVLDQPGLDDAAGLIEALPEEKAAAILAAMSADRQADVFRDLSVATRGLLFARLDAESREALDRLLSYPENTAGALMTTEFVSAPANWTVAETLEHIRKVERTRETVYAIYVLDPRTKKLLRAISLRKLITAAPHQTLLQAAADRRPIVTTPLADQEEVARLISKYDLLAVPVVDRGGHVLGIVTVDDVIDAILEEGTEDVQKFGGTEALDEPYMQIGFGTMIRKRAGWLCVLFLSEMLTASAMQHFDSELQRAIVLALFIPLIMSSGGNSGSQATSLIIRALALREVRLRDWWKVVLREFPTGIVLGCTLGVIAIIRITVWQEAGFYDYGEHWPLVALTVAISLVGLVTFGSVVGSMLPFVLKRIGFDPANASAPFIATLVDVTGLVIYFSVASVILGGVLL